MDVEKLLGGLEKSQAKTEAEIAKVEAQLANPQFVERAKPEVVEKLRENLDTLRAALTQLEERRKLFA